MATFLAKLRNITVTNLSLKSFYWPVTIFLKAFVNNITVKMKLILLYKLTLIL